MDNNLSKDKKRFSKEGAVIGAIVGAFGGSLMGWLGSKFEFGFLTRALIVFAGAVILGGTLCYLLKKRR